MKALILQVFYQPEGVSLRFYPQPEANAFRLIQPNRCNNYYLFNLVSSSGVVLQLSKSWPPLLQPLISILCTVARAP